MFSRRVRVLDELHAETEADHRVVAEQSHEHHEHARNSALQAERRALEEAEQRQGDDEDERPHAAISAASVRAVHAASDVLHAASDRRQFNLRLNEIKKKLRYRRKYCLCLSPTSRNNLTVLTFCKNDSGYAFHP